jgi:Flp pilus assembly protein TadG
MNRTKTTRIASDFTSQFTEECGQEIVEAALVLPILFLILLAIFWFGRAFNIVSTLERAARLGVQTATEPSCAVCGNAFSTDSQIATSVISALHADHLDIGNLTPSSPPFACIATPAPTCTTTPENVVICTGVPVTCGASSCQSPPANCGADAALGTRVSFGYRFTALPIASLNARTITGSAQSEPER